MKGFIFSIDAAVALISVMLVAMIFASHLNTPQAESNAYQVSERDARDGAVVGRYLEKSAGNLGLDSSLPLGKENASCVKAYSFSTTPPYASDQNYCKGI